MLWRKRTLVRHSIDGLNLKGVLGVSQQVADADPGVRQTQLPRHELDVVSTTGAATPPAVAAFTDDVVDEVFATAALQWWAPLQRHRGFIHH